MKWGIVLKMWTLDENISHILSTYSPIIKDRKLLPPLGMAFTMALWPWLSCHCVWVRACVRVCVCARVCVCLSVSGAWLFATPWSVARQAALSMEFSRQEYWSGLPVSFLGDLPDPGINPRCPALPLDSLPPEPPGKQLCHCNQLLFNLPSFLKIHSWNWAFKKIESKSWSCIQSVHIVSSQVNRHDIGGESVL